MNRLSEKGAFISKSEAAMLQAVAVMLMVWHHLFTAPGRIAEPYVLILEGLFRCESRMAYFGKICVAIFAFVSGYGMRKKAVNGSGKINLLADYKGIASQLLKFFSRYWMVFFVFVPIGYLLRVYPVDIRKFLLGVIGGANAGPGCFNEEWWYITFYIRFLLMFPLVNLFINILCRIRPVLLHIFMLLCIAGCALFPKTNPHYAFVLYFCCFLEGVYFVDSRVFETVYRFLQSKSWLRLGLGCMSLILVFFVRDLGVADFWLVPVFAFSVMLICKTEFLMRWLRPVLLFVGKYSTYIWLTHTFFAYYFFQKITFAPRYSWLIFLWCMVLSIASGMVLEGLLTIIKKGTQRLFAKRNYE